MDIRLSTHIELLTIRLTQSLASPTELSAKAERAARNGDTATAEALRQQGATINLIARGFALGGHHETVEKYRVKHKANINHIAIAYAISGYHEQVEHYRLVFGADPELIIRAYILAHRLEHVPKYLRLGVSESFIAASYMIAEIRIPHFFEISESYNPGRVAYWLAKSGAISLVEKLYLEQPFDTSQIILALRERSSPYMVSQFLFYLSSCQNDQFRQRLARELQPHIAEQKLYGRATLMQQMLTKHGISYQTAYSLSSQQMYRDTSLLLNKAKLSHNHYLEVLPWRWLEIRLLFLQCHYQSYFRRLPLDLLFYLVEFIVPQGMNPTHAGLKKIQHLHTHHLLTVDISRYQRFSYLFNPERKAAKLFLKTHRLLPTEEKNQLVISTINRLEKETPTQLTTLLTKQRTRLC